MIGLYRMKFFNWKEKKPITLYHAVTLEKRQKNNNQIKTTYIYTKNYASYIHATELQNLVCVGINYNN